jgi:single-stranded-DNA-specific exonuclease
MELSPNQLEFLERCKEARKAALSFKDPLIVHHYDADGLSAGAVAISAFLKQNKKHRSLPAKKLDDALIEQLQKEKEVILIDLGGGNKRVNELRDTVIIDQTEGVEKLQANPLLFGIDGGAELSSSGAASLVFNHHFDLGVIGAVGDMQYPLSGMNRYVLQEGTDSGELETRNELRLYGRYSRPLVDFLAYSDDPFMPSLTYNAENCEKFLSDLGIGLKEGESWRKYSGLSFEEKKKLISALAKLLIDKGMGWAAEGLVGEAYLLPRRESQPGIYDAAEFSTVLNACGRHSNAEVGVSLCLGKEGAYEKALELLRKHKLAIREGVTFAKGSINDFGPFFFIDARGVVEDSIIGIVCGMVSGGKGKPVLGAALSESGVKVSSRGTKRLVDAGLNLGKVMSQASEEVGGVGGGHRIAAGANIPVESLSRFLFSAGRLLRQ